MAGSARLKPEFELALSYGPVRQRPAFAALMSLDARLSEVVARTREPQLGVIALAWWRDSLLGLEAGPYVGSDPVLAGCATLLMRHDVTARDLSEVAWGWTHLFDDMPLDAAPLAAFANARGEGLFAIAAKIAGVPHEVGPGTAFAATDFAWRCSDAVTRKRALAIARAAPDARLPRSLRPFALLASWAKADISRLESGTPPADMRTRALTALRFALIGR